MRACISQNGSYSRQAELRLLQALYPGEAGQPCSSADRHQHRRRSADAWSSDDEETARREADPPPSTGKHCSKADIHSRINGITIPKLAVPGVMWYTMVDSPE